MNVASAVREDRLWQRHADMAKLGGTPKGGVNRQALSAEDAAARNLLGAWAKARGFTTFTDAIGGTEKSDVTDQLKVDGVDFTYSFIKRAFNLSAEAIAFTSPQVLDVALRDLGRAYNRGTEKFAVTALEAIDATGDDVYAAVFEELLLRGFLFGRLEASPLGSGGAVLVTAVLLAALQRRATAP